MPSRPANSVATTPSCDGKAVSVALCEAAFNARSERERERGRETGIAWHGPQFLRNWREMVRESESERYSVYMFFNVKDPVLIVFVYMCAAKTWGDRHLELVIGRQPG